MAGILEPYAALSDPDPTIREFGKPAESVPGGRNCHFSAGRLERAKPSPLFQHSSSFWIASFHNGCYCS